MSSSNKAIPPSIKYDWLVLKSVCQGSLIKAAKVMIMLYVPGSEYGMEIRLAGEAYLRATRRDVNFLSNGVASLTVMKKAKIEFRYIGQYLEFAAYRDILEYHKTGNIRLNKTLVLDLLDAGKLSRDNPLVKIRGNEIVFPVEHMH